MNPPAFVVIVRTMGRRAEVTPADVLAEVEANGPDFVRASLARRLGVAEGSVRRAVKRTAAGHPAAWRAAVDSRRERLRSSPGRVRVRHGGRRPDRVEVPAAAPEAVVAVSAPANDDVPARWPASKWLSHLKAVVPAVAAPCSLALEVLASTLEDWSVLRDWADAHGPVVRDEQGRTVRNPWWQEKTDLRREIWAMLKEVGLTPSAFIRLRVRVEEGRAAGASADERRRRMDGDDDEEDWFQGP